MGIISIANSNDSNNFSLLFLRPFDCRFITLFYSSGDYINIETGKTVPSSAVPPEVARKSATIGGRLPLAPTSTPATNPSAGPQAKSRTLDSRDRQFSEV